MNLAYVVSDLTYPPREGLHQQSVTLIRTLQESGLEVDLFGFAKDTSVIDMSGLADEGIRFRSPPIRYSGSVLAHAALRRVIPSRQISLMVSRLVGGEYSIAHLEGVLAASLAPRLNPLPTVVSFVDPFSRRHARRARTISNLPAKLVHLAAAGVAYALESSLRGQNCLWHVVSPADREYLKRAHRYRDCYSIPISLPLSIRSTPIGPSLSQTGLTSDPRKLRVLIYGDLRQPYMRDSTMTIVADVVAKSIRRSSIDLVLMGRVSDGDPWLGEVSSIFPLTNIPWVNDYQAVVQSSDIVLVPDEFGTGLKNRVVQALALGRPVLGGPVAFEGLPVADGVSAAIGQDHEGLRSRLDDLLGDTGLRDRLGSAGSELALARYGRAAVADEWVGLYNACVGRVG